MEVMHIVFFAGMNFNDFVFVIYCLTRFRHHFYKRMMLPFNSNKHVPIDGGFLLLKSAIKLSNILFCEITCFSTVSIIALILGQALLATWLRHDYQYGDMTEA